MIQHDDDVRPGAPSVGDEARLAKLAAEAPLLSPETRARLAELLTP